MSSTFDDIITHDASDECLACRAQDIVNASLVPAVAAWEDAYQLSGSTQMGIAKRLLERYHWWELEPHPEWVKPHWDSKNYLACYAAGIPKELRIIFIPVQVGLPPIIKELESEVTYRAFYYDPRNGREYPVGIVKPNIKGEWTTPLFPIFQDRILVLEKD